MELIDNIKNCIKNYIKNSNLNVETDNSKEICNGESYYCPTTKTLKIPVIDATFSQRNTSSDSLFKLSTIFHECIHSTREALNRETLEYDEEECVAELGAYLFMQKISSALDRKMQVINDLQHFSYLSCWFNHTKGEEQYIDLTTYTKTLNYAKEAVNYILKVGGIQ